MAKRALGPATLQVVAAVERAAQGPILVACSGGADSLALAAGAAVHARRSGVGIRAVVVDHQLQADSAQVAQQVANQLRNLDVPIEVVKVQVAPPGMEAQAREARYRALLDAATADEEIHLGHTRDDQAETVLLGLARGSGTRSLAGMAPRSGRLVRPLLGLTRTVTSQACTELGLAPWQDPHNQDPKFTRVMVRQQVLPLLEATLGPGIVAALARTADLARADADALDAIAEAELRDRSSDTLECGWLAGLASAIGSRVLLRWLRDQGATDLSAVHLQAVRALIDDWRGQRWVEVPGLRILRESGRLVAVPSGTRPAAGTSKVN